MRKILSIFLLLFFLSPYPPVYGNETLKYKKQALSATQEKLEKERLQKQELDNKILFIENELSQTKESLISTAARIRGNEEDLRDIENRIKILEESKSSMTQKLAQDRKIIANLILMLERIRRSPPEAMLANPNSPYKTAQSALLMGQLIPSIDRHTNALKKNLETLDNVSEDLMKERENQQNISNSLKDQHETLSSLLSTRETIYKQTNQDIHAREVNIEKISLKAQNLEDLVSKLKEEENIERKRMEKLTGNSEIEKNLAAFSDRLQLKQISAKGLGQAQLPISGVITVQYKQKDDLGAPSNGLTIEGRDGALVVAPLSGKIQFAGAFKKYGNIVIIEHEDGYHSLVAGLEKIDTLVGEYVESGEPIGKLPNSSSTGTSPKLYYELRKNGKPINPSKKFTDLG